MSATAPVPVEGIFDNLKIFNWARSLIAGIQDGDFEKIIESLKAIADLLGFAEWSAEVMELVSDSKALIVAVNAKDWAAVLREVSEIAEDIAAILRRASAKLPQKPILVGAAGPSLEELDKRLADLAANKVKLDPITIIGLFATFLTIFKNLPDFLAYVREWWAKHKPATA